MAGKTWLRLRDITVRIRGKISTKELVFLLLLLGVELAHCKLIDCVQVNVTGIA